MKKVILFATLVALVFTSCGQDYLEPEDSRYLNKETAAGVGSDNPDAFLNGIWSWMVEYNPTNASSGPHDTFGWMSICLVSDMQGIDMTASAFHWFCYDYDFDNRLESYRRTNSHWTILYTMVDKANAIIGTDPDNAALLGQARAIRGLAYLTLIQLYQLPVGADGKINRSLPGVPIIYTNGKVDTEFLKTAGKTAEDYQGRNTVGDVLDQAGRDLAAAVTLLEGTDYTRPNKNFIDASVANGLAARYYLFVQDWDNAITCAQNAKVGYDLMNRSDLLAGFYDINNSEWMWGFDHNTETATSYASFFSMISSYGAGYGNGYCTKLIDASLYDMIPASDYRKSWFTGPDGDGSSAANLPYANKKFGSDGNRTEDYVYMRAAEMYLIEAEAQAQKGNTQEAAAALKPLMNKRDINWDKNDVTLEEVLVQRRIELWGEGFGSFDLKRLNRGIDRNYPGSNHMAGYKYAVPAQDPRWTLQIPLKEIQENPSISEAEQND